MSTTANPFDRLQQAVNEAIAGINAQLAGLPSLEQFEANQDLQWPIRRIKDVASALRALAEPLVSKSVEIQAEIVKKHGEDVAAGITAEIKKLVDAGEYVPKAISEAALQSGISAERTRVETELKTKYDNSAKVVTIRAEMITKKTLPAVAVEKLSDEVILSPTRDIMVGIVAERIKRLADIGVTPETSPEMVGISASLPLTEAGETEFVEKHLKPITAMKTAAIKAAGLPASQISNPLAGITAEVQPGDDDEVVPAADKKLMLF